jgi:TrmH family RNA methyltransferase
VAHRVGSSTSPQPLLAVVGMIDVALAALPAEGLVLVCAEVRDPGNLGTVLRSAEAGGARGVVCAAGSVDPYNSKCVRASAGALFHIPVVLGDETVQVLEQLSASGFRRLGTSARGGDPLWQSDLTGPVAVVLGNEAHGLGADVGAHLDGTISIPIRGRSESLNVATAASVIVFEAARQRETR